MTGRPPSWWNDPDPPAVVAKPYAPDPATDTWTTLKGITKKIVDLDSDHLLSIERMLRRGRDWRGVDVTHMRHKLPVINTEIDRRNLTRLPMDWS